MQSYQTDWEALLSRSPAPFIASVGKWMYPTAARGGDGGRAPLVNGGLADAAALPLPPPVDELPSVKELLPTLRARLEALNGPKAPRIHMK